MITRDSANKQIKRKKYYSLSINLVRFENRVLNIFHFINSKSNFISFVLLKSANQIL